MSKTNLCFIGLSRKFTDDVCKALSIKLDMYYADVSKILEFELMDLKHVEELCGIEYLIKEERSIIKRLCTYENTILNIEYSTLNNESTLKDVRDNCLLVYLKIDKARYSTEQDLEGLSDNEKSNNIDVFDDRDFICKRITDVTINCSELEGDKLIDMIVEQILKYYS